MVTVLVKHRVADYDAWKQMYDRVNAGPLGSQLRSFRVWRGQDDPNLVIVSETFDSREVADELFQSEAVAEEMANGTVEMSSVKIEFLDEVDSSTP